MCRCCCWIFPFWRKPVEHPTPPAPEPTRPKPPLDKELFQNTNCVMVCALYDYTPSEANELKFSRDDMLKVTGLFGQPWQMAENTRTGQKGLIPHNYVTESTEIAGCLSAWYPANRVEAEKRLLVPGNKLGSYMIRPLRSKCLK
ncbi:unnamed protein product [Rodentolepis nana]|uniref:SH3 domain-containing protein n=1 Tax=Rodentolepis nana TaxID=102285 RepID=A0A0R3TH93_RODNA|nr:unnamed protein product [Rodentolepis nana]